MAVSILLGFSIFFNEEITNETEKYVDKMRQAGFEGVFSSLHIPEDDGRTYHHKLARLGSIMKKHQMALMIDISTLGLKTLGYDIHSEEDIKKIKALGVTGLRMDYGLSYPLIAQLSQQIMIGLNASTLTLEEVEVLKNNQADFSNMALWHNYYPRQETGLSMETFKDKNRLFEKLGLKICAFAPGDEVLRGPLYQGLPTLEDHRHSHPLVSTVELFESGYVSDVYIGDPGISLKTMKAFRDYYENNLVSLEMQVFDKKHADLFVGKHTNRVDDARDVVRSQEARFKELPVIAPNELRPRMKGSITLDNEKYGRYMGELQLVKQTLVADERVNVVAQVLEEDQPLINIIKPGMTFELKEKGE